MLSAFYSQIWENFCVHSKIDEILGDEEGSSSKPLTWDQACVMIANLRNTMVSNMDKRDKTILFIKGKSKLELQEKFEKPTMEVPIELLSQTYSNQTSFPLSGATSLGLLDLTAIGDIESSINLCFTPSVSGRPLSPGEGSCRMPTRLTLDASAAAVQQPSLSATPVSDHRNLLRMLTYDSNKDNAQFKSELDALRTKIERLGCDMDHKMDAFGFVHIKEMTPKSITIEEISLSASPLALTLPKQLTLSAEKSLPTTLSPLVLTPNSSRGGITPRSPNFDGHTHAHTYTLTHTSSNTQVAGLATLSDRMSYTRFHGTPDFNRVNSNDHLSLRSTKQFSIPVAKPLMLAQSSSHHNPALPKTIPIKTM